MSPSKVRHKTSYHGVYFVESTKKVRNKQEKIFYIYYYKNGKQYEESVGRQYRDDMTPARASVIRSSRINGNTLPNSEKRRKRLPERKTLNYLWDIYKERKHLIKSIKNDGYRYEKYIREPFGDKTPEEITPDEIDLLTKKLLKKLKPQTVKHILVQIKRVINFAYSLHISQPLNFKIDMPKFDNMKTEFLTEDQYASLLEVLDKEENVGAACLMKIALFTGIRKMDILRLEWRDIDFDRGFVYLRTPKGMIAEYIPLNESTREVFESLNPKHGKVLIFPNKDGRLRDRTSFSKPLKRIIEIAGIPKDFRPMHGLRHTFASDLASSGEVDLYTLQKLMGHKSPKMTQRYAHLRDETLKKASAVTDALRKKRKKRE